MKSRTNQKCAASQQHYRLQQGVPVQCGRQNGEYVSGLWSSLQAAGRIARPTKPAAFRTHYTSLSGSSRVSPLRRHEIQGTHDQLMEQDQNDQRHEENHPAGGLVEKAFGKLDRKSTR